MQLVFVVEHARCGRVVVLVVGEHVGVLYVDLVWVVREYGVVVGVDQVHFYFGDDAVY